MYLVGSELVKWKRSQSKYTAEGKRRLEAASVLQAFSAHNRELKLVHGFEQ